MNATTAPQPKLSFPAAWDDNPDEAAFSENGCPASVDLMREYLKNCHYHYVLDEETLELGEFVQASRWTFPDRQFWLWSCLDGVGREWCVLVGSGRSPFAEETENRKCWFFGKTNTDRMTPDEFLADEFPGYADMSGKAN